MDEIKLTELLDKYFENQSYHERLILFWYDKDGINEEILAKVPLGDVKLHKLTGSNNLATKKLIEHDDLDSSYIIYAPFEKLEPKNDWFIDTKFYSKEFTVDEVANLCSEFNVFDFDIKNIIKTHLPFFKNKERITRIKEILPSEKSTYNFYLGMIAVVLKERMFDINRIVQKYIIDSLINKSEIELAKYGLEEKFWEIISKHFGYNGEQKAKMLLAGIVFRILEQKLKTTNFPKGSANREKVLRAYNPNSKVLSFDDLDTLSRDELRSTFAGLDIIYIYHNKIDATGDKANTEKDVFNAVDETIQRITEKVKYLFNNSLCGNVMITADHGFLYQYSDLQEHQKITIGAVNNAVQVNKRFVLAKAPINETGVLHFNMKHFLRESDLTASIPFNINRFKTSGPGINYVHGGASLQEIVIPVLNIRQNKKLEIKKVDVQLTNASNRITANHHTLNFFQKEAVSENVMPRRLQVFLLDEETNTKISNDIIIDADIESEEIQSREFNKNLILKNFKYQKGKDYSLVIKDVDEDGEPYAKKIFMVDLAFSNEF